MNGQLIEIPEGYDIKVSSYPVETIKYPAFLLGPAPYTVVVEDEQGNETITEQYLPDFDSYTKNAYSSQKLAIIDTPDICEINVLPGSYAIRFSTIRLQKPN